MRKSFTISHLDIVNKRARRAVNWNQRVSIMLLEILHEKGKFSR